MISAGASACFASPDLQLRIYNTLTRQKEVFEPLTPGKVGLYVCGVTVYDYSHVGHARVYTFFDVVCRALRKLGYEVTYVRNFTDVDDKIIKRAGENQESCDQLTDRVIASYHADMQALGNDSPQVEPRVTTHIGEIVAMIQTIIDRGHAYPVPGEVQPDGTIARDVYFDVASYPAYGRLSGRSTEDNAEGASERVQFDSRKRNQADFALWKSAKPGEPAWESPWGAGRPGWHIECSAMSCKHLGPVFDLHGGGKDLIFPHHENEIAQSVAATGDRFALRWMHVAFLTVDQEKMSKSLGNFFTIRDVLARFHPQVLRAFLLSAHYLHPLNFSDKALEETSRRVLYVYEKLALADQVLAQAKAGAAKANGTPDLPMVAQARQELWEALTDDFNVPRAMAALSEPLAALAQALEKPKAAGNLDTIAQVRAFVREAGEVLGLYHLPPQDVADAIVESARLRLFPQGSEKLARVERCMAEREAARQARDWSRADELRRQLLDEGVEVRDTRDGSTWRPQLSASE